MSGEGGAIERLIAARTRTLIGSFTVRRVLPFSRRRSVGPFVFLDHMGPVDLPAGGGGDIPPHPHIGLATLTYLFEGRFLHRDSLGSVQRIEPGEVNWMTAGRGIVHSERMPPEDRARPTSLHGLQTWVALPRTHEEIAPSFHHASRDQLPSVELGRARVHVVAGAVYGVKSPVPVYSDLFYADLRLPEGASVPAPDEHAERGVYVVSGALDGEEGPIEEGTLALLKAGRPFTLRAQRDTVAMLLGGAPLDGPRSIWWNFVSSSDARIDEAKRAWAEDRFPRIEGETERVPLPPG